MASKLSFAIAINLLTENFKRGTNQVKAGFKAMQMQVLTFAAALGAGGLGLSNFVSRLIDVARETNRVTTALKNVSGSTGQFADNQRYLLDLAKKYGLEINALTGNFAKFTAAASISGMSMGEQRKIFESVSRACTAFGMSADDSNGVFLALSQMMSKGKISSEELRLQMGERLPVALQAMAKAAGVSVAGLDKLLKQGKLMSADVLPKFADALNEMIPNVDTDNLETSVNHLKNTFTEFVNGTDVQSKYKALIDWLTGAVQSAANNIKSIITYAIAAILVMVTSRLVNKIIAAIAKAGLAAKVEARNAAKAAGAAFDEVAWKAQKAGASMKMAFTKAFSSLKSTLISFAPTAIIAAIAAIIARFNDMYNATKRVKSIYSDYKRRVSESSGLPEVAQLKVLYDLYSKSNDKLGTKQQYLNRINSILGTELKAHDDINKAIEERISLLEASAKAEVYAKEVAEADVQIRKIGQKKYNGNKVSEMATDWAKVSPGDVVQESAFAKKYGVKLSTGWGGDTELRKELDSFVQLALILKDARDNLARVTKDSVSTTPTLTPDDDDKKKKTPLEKQQESFDKQFAELGAELEIGKLTQAEYNKALAELNVKMYAQAKGTNDKKVLESDYFKARKTAAEQAVKSMPDLKAKVELEKVEKEYTDARSAAKAKLEKGLIAEDGYREAIVNAAMKAAKSAASIEGVGTAADEFIGKMRNVAINNTLVPVLKQRDTTFDYKATEVDKVEGNLDAMKKYADELKEEISKGATYLQDEFNNAIANVDSLEKALKLAKVREDVKNFSKELDETIYSGVKDIAGSTDRVVSAFQNLKDVMGDVDATGWEKIMAIWNAMINTVDSFMSIVHTIENVSALTAKLAGAKEKQKSLEQGVTETVLTAGAQIAANQIATEMEIATSQRKTEAATTEMAAKSTAAYAGIPFGGVALAAGQIAAMVAMIEASRTSIPKFATGGIITGGPTSGDKILARVNAGEMILNHGQQSRLFDAINSGRLGNSQQINIGFDRVRGADILLAVNNTLKRQGKKPIS